MSGLLFFLSSYGAHHDLHSFPTRRSSDLSRSASALPGSMPRSASMCRTASTSVPMAASARSSTEVEAVRSEEHTSELQSLRHLVCRLLLEKKKKRQNSNHEKAGAMTSSRT